MATPTRVMLRGDYQAGAALKPGIIDREDPASPSAPLDQALSFLIVLLHSIGLSNRKQHASLALRLGHYPRRDKSGGIGRRGWWQLRPSWLAGRGGLALSRLPIPEGSRSRSSGMS